MSQINAKEFVHNTAYSVQQPYLAGHSLWTFNQDIQFIVNLFNQDIQFIVNLFNQDIQFIATLFNLHCQLNTRSNLCDTTVRHLDLVAPLVLCLMYNYEKKNISGYIQGVPRNMTVGEQFKMSSSIIILSCLIPNRIIKKKCIAVIL